jgi:hypothetical protein
MSRLPQTFSMAVFFLFAVLVSAVVCSTPVPLILDTDMGGGACQDVDDVGALCIAHTLADNGEANLLAVVQNSRPPQVAGVISAINHYFNRPVPIGANKRPGPDNQLSYVAHIAENFPSPIKSTSQVPDAVDVYRKVLAGQPDHSVVIASVGVLSNLEALLMSPPDALSTLSGRELVAQKVKLVAMMGGKYPDALSTGHECNFCGCFNGANVTSAISASSATAYVVNNMPPQVQMIYSGFDIGVQIESGAILETCAPVQSPCRAAYMNFKYNEGSSFGFTAKGRASWDPLTTLIAVRGVAALGGTTVPGRNSVNPLTGENWWTPTTTSNQNYVVMSDFKAAGKTLDELLCKRPITAEMRLWLWLAEKRDEACKFRNALVAMVASGTAGFFVIWFTRSRSLRPVSAREPLLAVC